MMKKVKILSLIAGLSFSAYIAVVLPGCKGSNGDPGAQGITGPVGPTGVNGVSNIKIEPFTVANPSWVPLVGPPLSFFYTTSDAEITDPQKEAVTAFYSFGSVNGKYNWQPLPATDVLGHGDQLSFGWNTGHITFTYDSAGPSFTAPSPTLYFNVAVIPPAIIQRHPNTNWKDGAAIMKLPEMQAALNAEALKQ